jgi:hypothetical protein
MEGRIENTTSNSSSVDVFILLKWKNVSTSSCLATDVPAVHLLLGNYFSFEQSLDSSLHPPSMIFVTQGTNCIGFIFQMK